MLENCFSLFECEKVLEKTLTEVKFIGQIGLTLEDVALLADFIRKRLEDDVQEGTRYLCDRTPSALACYLVGHGVYFYSDGDYWGSLSNNVHIDDVNWQRRVGQNFLTFLNKLQLPMLEIPGTHKYVANILLHGGIPQSCMPEFFDKVLYPAILDDLIDADEIKISLNDLRERERYYQDILTECHALKREKRAINNKRLQVSQHLRILEEIETLQCKLAKCHDVNILPYDFDVFRKKNSMELVRITQFKRALYEQEKVCKSKIDKYKSLDEQIVSLAETVERFFREYNSMSEIFETIEELNMRFNEYSEKMNKLINELELDDPPKTYDSLLVELPWERLYAVLEDGRKLEIELTKLEIDAGKTSIKQNKPGVVLWVGLSVFIAGLIAVTFNPSQAILWLLPAPGLFLIFYRGLSYRAELRKTKQMKKQLATLENKSVQLKQKISYQGDRLRQLAGLLYNPKASFWNKSISEMTCFFRELQDTCRKMVMIAAKMDEAQERENIWRRGFSEVVATLDIRLQDDNMEDTFLQAQKIISEALYRKEKAEQAGKELKIILEKLSDLDVQEGQIRAELDNVTKAVTVLGNGDLEHGIKLLNEYRKNVGRLDELQQELKRIEEQGLYDEVLYLKSAELRDLFNKLDESYQEKEKELLYKEGIRENTSRPFSYLDKPIRRFLLYGGVWAERWLVDGVRMAAAVITGKKHQESDSSALPMWFTQAFLPGGIKNPALMIFKQLRLRQDRACTHRSLFSAPPVTSLYLYQSKGFI